MAITLCLSGFAIGQDITGTIVGTVKDASGGVVPGATVTITDPGKRNLVVRTIETNDEGTYSAPNLAVSIYNVTVEAANFKKAVNTDIKLDVGQRRTVDIVLEAGRIDEVVTVQADPVAVDLTSATAGTLISGDQIRELSINNRNFVQLVTLAPGVTNDLEDLVFTGTNNPETQVVNRTLISVNGGRPTQNTYTVDGADVTDRGSNLTIQAYPSVDSIGEFRVLRSLYPAETGQSAGGQVNVVTRSGTSEFHGSAFEFIRNEAFNANNFTTNSSPNPAFGRDENGKARRRPFRYNNYGWTVGGPVYFFNFGENDGGIFRRWDKTFFFYSQEFRKDTRYPTLQSTVPTTALKNGIFPVDICLRGTIVGSARTCLDTLPAGQALSSRVPISPIAQQYVDEIWRNVPDPNGTATAANPLAGYLLNFPTLNIAEFQQEIVKIDHTFSDKASAYYRFQRDTIPTTDADGSIGTRSGMPFVNTMASDSPGRTHTLSGTYAFNSNFIIEGRFTHGYGGIFTETTGLIAKNVSTISAPLPFENARDVVPVLGVAGFNSLTGFSNYDNFSWKQGYSANVTWILGNHTTKYGVLFSRYRKNENAIAGANQGSFSGFNNTPAVLPAGQSAGSVTVLPVTPTPPSGTSNYYNAMQAWANFLQGNNVGFTQSKFDLTADLRQRNFEAFAQDEWRIRQGLTLYFGVRYSFFGSPIDADGHFTNFDPALWTPAQAPRVTGAGNRIADAGSNYCNGLIINSQNFTTGLPVYNCQPTLSPWGEHVYNAGKLDFAPRIGVAWDPFGKGETSVRAGYGIYYDQISGNQALLIIGLNPPYQETCTITGTTLAQPVPGNNCTTPVFSSAAASIRGIQTEWDTPYVQQWSLDIQQQLSKNTLFTAGYYGSRGVHLNGHTEYNNLQPGVAAETQCATGSQTLQDPNPTTQLCQTPGTSIDSAAESNLLDQRRPYRGYRSISVLESRYNSDYHSLQVSGQHRFSGASQVNLAYTWSKSLTDNPTSYINAAPQNNWDIRSERGRSPLDRTHVLTISGLYELPFFSAQNGFVGKLLGGWQASGIYSYQTGSPYTVTSATYDPAGIGFIPSIIAGGRPDLLCDPNEGAPHTIGEWFNTACFSPQALTGIENREGNAGRGIIVGPPTTKVDFTLSKKIRFSEDMSLQLRAEAFNVFNITNYRIGSTPNLGRTSATFGQVTSFRDPRVLQLGIKFYF